MEINRHNYEKYLIDYLDGTLPESLGRELMRFLDLHPDLKAEMEGLDQYRLEPVNDMYNGKKLLKKSLFSIMNRKQMSYDELCVAGMEGDLEQKEQELLFSYINEDRARQEEHELLKKTILEPDLNIVFAHKQRIKKQAFVVYRRIIYPAVSAAAAVLVLFVLLFRPETVPAPDMISAGSQDNANGQTQAASLEKIAPVSASSVLSRQEITLPDSRLVPVPVKNAGFSAERITIVAIPAMYNTLVSYNHPRKEFTVRRSYTKYEYLYDEYKAPEEFLTGLIRKTITGEDAGVSEGPLTIRELANAGIQKLEELTADNFEISRSYDPEGNIQRFTLETNFFGISAPGRQNNPPE
jgi:hypothetical protein